MSSPKIDWYHVYEEHRARLLAIATRILHDRDEAEDVAQQTLAVAWRRRHTLRDPDRFEAWITSIARNIALTRLRHRDHQARTVILVGSWTDELGTEPTYERFEPLSCRLAYGEALETLNDSERRALEWRLAGYSNYELAVAERASEGAVKTRLSRAKRKLTEALL